MAIDRVPVAKRCKRLGVSPAVLGYGKSKSTSRGSKEKNQRNKKISGYGLQLREKQKLKFIYGVLEKQFFHYYELATKEQGVTGENLIKLLESRLDNIVFRANFAGTRRESRQLVGHGHFTVNGKRVDIPSYRVKAGDIVAVHASSKKSPKFQQIADATHGRTSPVWLEVNKDAQSATITRLPERNELDFEIAEHLIIELYSK
ncbi:MAG: 30S ribosomal protein S4 [Oscillospiraceae bacterium]|jgi:small subunit ribosomal protein S4|nr:30S ribosomal protein S4 [Oscillospiraceae bacterium]